MTASQNTRPLTHIKGNNTNLQLTSKDWDQNLDLPSAFSNTGNYLTGVSGLLFATNEPFRQQYHDSLYEETVSRKDISASFVQEQLLPAGVLSDAKFDHAYTEDPLDVDPACTFSVRPNETLIKAQLEVQTTIMESGQSQPSLAASLTDLSQDTQGESTSNHARQLQTTDSVNSVGTVVAVNNKKLSTGSTGDAEFLWGIVEQHLALKKGSNEEAEFSLTNLAEAPCSDASAPLEGKAFSQIRSVLPSDLGALENSLHPKSGATLQISDKDSCRLVLPSAQIPDHLSAAAAIATAAVAGEESASVGGIGSAMAHNVLYKNVVWTHVAASGVSAAIKKQGVNLLELRSAFFGPRVPSHEEMEMKSLSGAVPSSTTSELIDDAASQLSNPSAAGLPGGGMRAVGTWEPAAGSPAFSPAAHAPLGYRSSSLVMNSSGLSAAAQGPSSACRFVAAAVRESATTPTTTSAPAAVGSTSSDAVFATPDLQAKPIPDYDCLEHNKSDPPVGYITRETCSAPNSCSEHAGLSQDTILTKNMNGIEGPVSPLLAADSVDDGDFVASLQQDGVTLALENHRVMGTAVGLDRDQSVCSHYFFSSPPLPTAMYETIEKTPTGLHRPPANAQLPRESPERERQQQEAVPLLAKGSAPLEGPPSGSPVSAFGGVFASYGALQSNLLNYVTTTALSAASSVNLRSFLPSSIIGLASTPLDAPKAQNAGSMARPSLAQAQPMHLSPQRSSPSSSPPASAVSATVTRTHDKGAASAQGQQQQQQQGMGLAVEECAPTSLLSGTPSKKDFAPPLPRSPDASPGNSARLGSDRPAMTEYTSGVLSSGLNEARAGSTVRSVAGLSAGSGSPSAVPDAPSHRHSANTSSGPPATAGIPFPNNNQVPSGGVASDASATEGASRASGIGAWFGLTKAAGQGGGKAGGLAKELDVFRASAVVMPQASDKSGSLDGVSGRSGGGGCGGGTHSHRTSTSGASSFLSYMLGPPVVSADANALSFPLTSRTAVQGAIVSPVGGGGAVEGGYRRWGSFFSGSASPTAAAAVAAVASGAAGQRPSFILPLTSNVDLSKYSKEDLVLADLDDVFNDPPPDLDSE